MSGTWETTAEGVLTLPSGRTVRGRSWRTDQQPDPELGLYLMGRRPPPRLSRRWPWEWVWLPWRDFGRPADPDRARQVLTDYWERAAHRRVEVACAGGRGRTGTVLACWAVLDGLEPDAAVAFVRRHHHPRAVETRGQRAFVVELAARHAGRRSSW